MKTEQKMSKFHISNHIVGSGRVFVIAEIGQNHQGDLATAKQMIKSAKECGADCVKFQKSCLREKFTSAALNRPYDSVNAWGRTYGEHKEYLEFTIDQYRQLQLYANELDIIFTASAMDVQSLNDLYGLNVPVMKIGSGDANNVQLITMAACNATPAIVSTGMQDEASVRRIVSIMHSNSKRNFCLMHCVSSYPTQPADVKLRLLEIYRKWFPDVCVGYSGHEVGVAIAGAAVLLGAQVIERHFTLDKNQKGTDHRLSLEPHELKRMICIIRAIEALNEPLCDTQDETILNILRKFDVDEGELNAVKLALANVDGKKLLDCELPCRNKLGKSLVFRRDLLAGAVLGSEDVCAKVSEPFGVSADRIDEFVGLKLNADVKVDLNLEEKHFKCT